MRETDASLTLPVCIADLEAHIVSVPPLTLTETVVELFENNPSLPGIMVMDRGRPTNVITRLKLFEQLGHRYGIELFLRKPIVELNRSLRLPTYIMPGYLRIDDAIRLALKRPPSDLYDPIVVEADTGHYQLLEMNLLLTAQSHIVMHLSNAVKNIAHIDHMLSSETDSEQVTRQIFAVLRQVIPHHHALIALPGGEGLTLLDAESRRELPAEMSRQFQRSAIYELLQKQGDAIYIPDTRCVPKWAEVSILGSPVAWLGVPIPRKGRLPGVLSISRRTATPFDVTEKETARSFARRISTLLERETNNHPLQPLHPFTSQIPALIKSSL
ncbi:MAG: GAF domain-containing protein [Anaerolineales bacterium]